MAATLLPGDIIFNEYVSTNVSSSNGNDFFELLVLKDGADLRGLRVSDNELQATGLLNNNESVFVFGQDSFLSNVPKGTTIAVWTLAAGVTTDTIVSAISGDWKLVLAPGTGVTTSIDGLGGSVNTGLSTTAEALYLYLPGPDGTSAGTDNIYLDFISFGNYGGVAPTGMNTQLATTTVNAYYTGNTAAGADVVANWTPLTLTQPWSPSPTGATPGDANPGQDLSALRVVTPLVIQPVLNHRLGDFSNDGKADIPLRLGSDGSVGTLLMDGTTFLPTSGNFACIDPAWKAISIADFGGDTKADMLFRHTDGRLLMWQMDGTVITPNSGVFATLGAEWTVIATGDFNGDGKDDIVSSKFDGLDHTLLMWQMDGTTITPNSGAFATFYDPDTSNYAQRTFVGDFNGDGKDDFLFQNSGNQLLMWQMDGTTILADSGVFATLPTGWKVNGTGDFNGDGKDDILFRRDDGALIIWEMNGTSISSSTGVISIIDTAFEVKGIGDFNGDNTDNILMSKSDGALLMLQMQNSAITPNSGGFASIGTDWTII